MLRRSPILVAGVLVLAGLLGRAPAAWACSCVASSTARLVKAADAVFVGTVSTVDTTLDGRTPARATFVVAEVYKGGVPASVTVETPHDEAACGVEFVPGRRYAVFASGGETMTTGLCSGTTDDADVLARAGREPVHVYPALGDPIAAPPDPRARASSARTGQIAAAALMLAVVGSAGVATVWRRRNALAA